MIYIAIQTNKTTAEVNDILINHAGFCDFSTEEYSEEKEMIYAVSFSEPLVLEKTLDDFSHKEIQEYLKYKEGEEG